MNSENTLDFNKRNPGLSRRETLQASGLLAVSIGANPAQTIPDLTPRLQHVWVRIKRTGAAEFVAKFASNVNYPFNLPGVSKDRVEDIASRGDAQFSLEPVGFDPAPDVPANRLITGVLSNFASRTTRDGTTFFIVNGMTIDEDEVNSQIPVLNPVSGMKPKRGRPFMTIIFPDGYRYRMPPSEVYDAAPRVYDNSGFLDDSDGIPPLPFDESPIEYNGTDRYLTLPRFTHRLNPDLAWLESVARLKYRLLALPGSPHRLRDLYTPTWYGNRAVERAYEVARNIGKELGKAAIEEVLLYKAPRIFTDPKEVADIATALSADFAIESDDTDQGDDDSGGGILDTILGFFGGGSNTSSQPPDIPKEFEQAADAHLNTAWMGEVVDFDWSFPEVQSAGLNSLFMTTQFERAWNHMYATAGRPSTAEPLLTIYQRTLEKQRDIAIQTRSNIRGAPTRPNDEYWEDLYTYAIDLCSEFQNLANSQIDILREM